MKAMKQAIQNIPPMFLGCGDVTANAAKYLRTRKTSRTAGYFLMHLCHPKVTFREVVVEGGVEIIHESQCLIGMIMQPVQKIPGRRLFYPASAPWYSWRGREGVSVITAGKDVVIAFAIGFERGWSQTLPSRSFCEFNSSFNMQKMLYHRSRPTLFQFCLNEFQFSQVMRIAQAMQVTEFEVGRPAIMYHSAIIIRQNSSLPYRLTATPRMAKVERMQACAKCMFPHPLAIDKHSRLIRMRDGRGMYRLLYGHLHRRQPLMGLEQDVIQRPFTQPDIEQIRHCFRRTLLRQQLVGGQIGDCRPYTRPVLNRRIHAYRKGSRMKLPAPARPHLSLMFRNFQTNRRHVKHLTPFMTFEPTVPGVSTAPAQAFEFMLLHSIGILDLLQAVSFVPRLTTTWLSALLPEALRLRSARIRGRRLAAVIAILGKILFQPLHSFLKKSDSLILKFHKADDGFHSLLEDRTYLNWRRQIKLMHNIKKVKSYHAKASHSSQFFLTPRDLSSYQESSNF
jgi:hypothetical protein